MSCRVLVCEILVTPATSTRFCNAWRTQSRLQPICRAGSTNPHVSAVATVNQSVQVQHVASDDNVAYELVDSKISSNCTDYYAWQTLAQLPITRYFVLNSGVAPKTTMPQNTFLRVKGVKDIRFYTPGQFTIYSDWISFINQGIQYHLQLRHFINWKVRVKAVHSTFKFRDVSYASIGKSIF